MGLNKQATVPWYAHNGAYLGHMRVDKALAAAEAGEVRLSWRGQGRRAQVTAAHSVVQRSIHPTACTLTLGDAVNNAMGQAFKALGCTDSIRALDRAMGKVRAWPEVHDTKAVCISAGRVIQPQAVS